METILLRNTCLSRPAQDCAFATATLSLDFLVPFSFLNQRSDASVHRDYQISEIGLIAFRVKDLHPDVTNNNNFFSELNSLSTPSKIECQYGRLKVSKKKRCEG